MLPVVRDAYDGVDLITNLARVYALTGEKYLAGKAEDMGQVVAVGETINLPFGTVKDCVRTKDWSRLESGSEMKWYAKGLGFVRSKSSSGEVSTMISVTQK